MNHDLLMIHYGELSTKGENKKAFIQELAKNIRHALKTFSGVVVTYDRDHAYVDLAGADPEPIISRLSDVSGIQKISLVHKSEKDFEALKTNALSLIKGEKGSTFKVVAKRADKHYQLDSYGIACGLGSYIEGNSPLKVDVHDPDITLRVDVRKDAAYLSCHSYPGAGGYPLGMNGKAMMLLSGGIDSPVASYLLLRRGIRIECVHFASPPYTSSGVIDKLVDILRVLNRYQDGIKINIVPFTALQDAIYRYVDEPYCITIMRRMMMRIAVALAKEHNCLSIATGESIGQVASQTLDSLIAINEVTNFPVIRPLAVTDKLSIIEESKKIGTYDISIRPYEDCCTIFKPKRPKTKPKPEECAFFESKWDWAPMVEECVKGAKPMMVDAGGIREFKPKQ